MHSVRRNDLLDHTLLLQVGKSSSGQAAVDLELVDESGDSQEAGGLDILVESVDLGLIEDDGVVSLVLNCKVAETCASAKNVFFARCWEISKLRIFAFLHGENKKRESPAPSALRKALKTIDYFVSPREKRIF